MYLLKKIWKPEMFQGKYKRRNYFEGWYFKAIDSNEDKVLGVIPGISYGITLENSQSFIQVIIGSGSSNEYKTFYFSYNIDQFLYSSKNFKVYIADNFFTREKMILNLENTLVKIEGELNFYNIIPFPSSPINPGIMGPFSFLPFMECYHGIVNIHHEIKGRLTIGDKEFYYDNSYGYIEKDWGKSFPEAYIWLQSNHFEQRDISIMFSIAKIPWFKKYFIGHISFLRIGEKFYRFGTYTGAQLTKLTVKNESMEIILEDKNYKLELVANYSKAGLLIAPQRGIMNREIMESVTSRVQVHLKDYKNTTIFRGEGKNTGLEMVGDLSLLIPR